MIWPIPSDEELFAIYSDRNSFTDIGDGDLARYLADPGPTRNWAKSLDSDLRGLGVLPGSRLVELGCMHGLVLLEMRRLGYDTLGVELSPDGVRWHTQQGGQAYCGTIFDEQCPATACDVVMCFHVLEHLRDPYAALRRIHSMLRPGGVFLFAVPHWGGLVAQKLRQRWKWFAPPFHLHYFSAEQLVTALTSFGFEVKDCRTDIGVHEVSEVVDAFELKAFDSAQFREGLAALMRGGLCGETLMVTAQRPAL